MQIVTKKQNESWFEVATNLYGHALGVAQLLADNPALWLPITRLEDSYEIVVSDYTQKQPNLR